MFTRKAIVTALLAAWVSAAAPPPRQLPYVYTHWKQFTVKDGLPNDHIFTVKVNGPQVWVGTEGGLAMIDKRTGEIKSWTEKDGLPWKVVSAIDVDPKTGDVWLGMFGGGLARFSGGRFDHWHQLNSGLVNDVVYGVAIEHDNVWIATTAGASRYNTVTGEWTIFTEKNAPMEEIWNYSAAYADGKVYLGIWGSGVLEYDVEKERWKDYVDPDGEMEIDLYRDDGIVHVITTGVSYVDKILWVGSYFGGCRYDGRNWRGYFNQDSGLPSDFINFVKAYGDVVYVCTVVGLSTFNSVVCITYKKTDQGGGTVFYKDGQITTKPTPAGISHDFTIGVDVQGDNIWVATSYGLSHGTRIN